MSCKHSSRVAISFLPHLTTSRRKVDIFPPTLANGINKNKLHNVKSTLSNTYKQQYNPYKHRAYLASYVVAISKSSWCPCRPDTRRLCTASLKASLTFAAAGRMAGDYKQQIYRCQSSDETMTSHKKHSNKMLH
jgi:hypothetical protein